MVIAIDCDEVLFPFVSPFCKFLNEKYGLHLKKRNFKEYAIWKCYGATQEQYILDVREFENSEDYRKIAPFDEAISEIPKLKSLDDLVILTSRDGSSEIHTRESTDRYFNGIFKKILFSSHQTFSPKGDSKREICNRENIRLLIEDSGLIAEDVSREIPVILLEKQCNKGFFGHNIFRAGDWREITEIAEMIYRG